MNSDPQNQESPWGMIDAPSMGSPVELKPTRKPSPPKNTGVAWGLAGGCLGLVLLGIVLYIVGEGSHLHETHVNGKIQKSKALHQAVAETH